MANEKALQLLEDFLNELPESHREMFGEIARCAIALGYAPKKTKSKDFVLDFTKNRVKRTILKMEVHDNAKPANPPGLRLKFFASSEYSDPFQRGIQRVIEEFGGKYTGCYGCGRCKGASEGYTFTYPDGRKVFRCGHELIAVHGLGGEHVPEIVELLKKQDAFFMAQVS